MNTPFSYLKCIAAFCDGVHFFRILVAGKTRCQKKKKAKMQIKWCCGAALLFSRERKSEASVSAVTYTAVTEKRKLPCGLFFRRYFLAASETQNKESLDIGCHDFS